MFPQVPDKLGTNTPRLSDSLSVLDSVAGWGRLGFGIRAKGWILTVSSLVEKSASCPTFFFFLSSLCTSSAYIVKKWPCSPNEWRPVDRSGAYRCCRAFQLDGPGALRRGVSCLCLTLCTSHSPLGLRNSPLPAHRLRRGT